MLQDQPAAAPQAAQRQRSQPSTPTSQAVAHVPTAQPASGPAQPASQTEIQPAADAAQERDGDIAQGFPVRVLAPVGWLASGGARLLRGIWRR